MGFPVTVPLAAPALRQTKEKVLAVTAVRVLTATVIAAASDVTVTLKRSPIIIPWLAWVTVAVVVTLVHARAATDPSFTKESMLTELVIKKFAIF